MSGLLPESVKGLILSFPEYKMGVHKVALVMTDGFVVEDVMVAWGEEVIRIGGVDGCTIELADVVGAEDRS